MRMIGPSRYNADMHERLMSRFRRCPGPIGISVDFFSFSGARYPNACLGTLGIVLTLLPANVEVIVETVQRSLYVHAGWGFYGPMMAVFQSQVWDIAVLGCITVGGAVIGSAAWRAWHDHSEI